MPDLNEPLLDALQMEFADNRLLSELFGAYNKNLTEIERALHVEIDQRGNQLFLRGETEARNAASGVLNRLYDRLAQGRSVEPGDVAAAIRLATGGAPAKPAKTTSAAPRPTEIRTRKRVIEPRTPNQKTYIRALLDRELAFGIGPAGTGKTYLAVAAAVAAFLDRRVERIILSRPAVEAGERLGFLPGDMKEKVDPYLRPLYDALHDMLPAEQVTKYLENGVFEVAPLAFMRGRTLAHSAVVLDEAQNCTSMQMKMFLTRLGEGSHMAITGDPSQVDLPPGQQSGLREAVRLLEGVKGVAVTRFTREDVVRHPLVARIIDAYDADFHRKNAANGADGDA